MTDILYTSCLHCLHYDSHLCHKGPVHSMPAKSQLVMCQAGLGLKPWVWAGPSRAQAYEKSSLTLS
jgi:hypothetical protein